MFSPRSIIFILIFGISLALLVVLLTQNRLQNNAISPTPNPTTETSSAPPSATPNLSSPQTDTGETSTNTSRSVSLYLIKLEDNGKQGPKIGCGDSVVSTNVEIPPTQTPLKDTLTKLLALKGPNLEGNLYNSLYQQTLKVDSISLKDGKATINLSGQLSIGGVCDSTRVKAQLESTAKQFPTVKETEIFINGKNLDDLLSEK